jgi:hypothetical protein
MFMLQKTQFATSSREQSGKPSAEEYAASAPLSKAKWVRKIGAELEEKHHWVEMERMGFFYHVPDGILAALVGCPGPRVWRQFHAGLD